jgi:lathosterol oxidase
VFLLVFALFLGHFLIIASAAWLGVWQLGREAFAAHRVQQSPLRDPRPRRELAFSVLSILIFSLLLTGLWVFERFGLTAIYWDVAEHGTAWFVSQIAVLALVHDSYYYWAHRWMHHPKVFRHVHKLHHGFHNPTPFASYAFHPFEAIVEVAWIAPLAFLMPIHPLALAGYVVFLTVLNVVSHLGHEFYPAWVARWFITSTHHNMHHTRAAGTSCCTSTSGIGSWARTLPTTRPRCARSTSGWLPGEAGPGRRAAPTQGPRATRRRKCPR